MPANKMERFTQRARRVLSLAQEAAERLHHSYIGTEHVLLGLMREEGGVAGRVLRDLGLEEQRVEALIEELTRTTSQTPTKSLDLAPGTKRVLELAVDEARRMGHHYIGTEHILLGLVRQADGVHMDVLKRLGISPEEVRRQTRRVLQESPVQNPQAADRPTEEAQPISPRNVPAYPQPPHSVAFPAIERFMMKVLQMIGENKITADQGAELLGTLLPEMRLLPGEKIKLTSQYQLPGDLEQRRIHVVFMDEKTKETKLDETFPLERILSIMDQVLEAAVKHQIATVKFAVSDTSSILLEFRLAEDK